MDEGDGEVQVGEVAADEGEGEHEADGDDVAEVDAPGHGDFFARVEHGGEAGHELGHDGCEAQVPGGERDGVVEFGGVEDPFVEEDDGAGEGDPGAAFGVSCCLVWYMCVCYSRNVDGRV